MDQVEAELNKLTDAELGCWEFVTPASCGGTPFRRYCLRGTGDGDTTLLKPEEFEGSVAVAATSSLEIEVENTADDDGVEVF